jgi:hypothetical protein
LAKGGSKYEFGDITIGQEIEAREKHAAVVEPGTDNKATKLRKGGKSDGLHGKRL